MNQTRMTDFISIQRLVDQLFVVTGHLEALDKIPLDELELVERRIQKAAASLRGNRNSRLPINRVPLEIMTEIFNLTQPNEPSFYPWSARDYDKDPRDLHQWIGLLERRQVHARPSTSTFLDFMETSPLLEVLILVGAGPTREDSIDLPPVSTGRMINLIALKELNIMGTMLPAFAVARLLAHLSLLVDAEVYISMTPLLGFDDDFASFLPTEITELRNFSNIEECVISRIDIGTTSSPQHIAIANSVLQLHSSFSPTQFTSLYDRYPLINIRKLSIHDASHDPDGSSVISTDQWKELFIRTPALQTLNIFRRAGSTPVTSRILTALEADHDKSFLCPLLQSLRIDDEYQMPTLRLFSIAKQRAEHGCPLLQLTISYAHQPTQPWSMEGVYLSSFNEEDAQMLETQVKEVVFQPRETSSVDPIFYPGFGSAYLQYVNRWWHISDG
ncbi:hypothetical protein C8J56DRAFT_1086187 [Mycena floridula]|nr:hypothetical protein C8J56DRAFT_1086187 [Mycena floridula]